MADQIGICNMALAEIVASPIQSLNEASLEARETGRFYPISVAAMLEAHPWGFATRRATLPLAVNDRAGEWSYAYALPTDMAMPVKLVPSLSALPSNWWLDDRVASATYVIEDRLIYCDAPSAMLAYVTTQVSAATFPARFVDALALDLASRIAMPIKKSREMKGDLIRQAEIARQRAMADDLNRQPNNIGWSNDVDMVRGGGWDTSTLYGNR